MLTRLILLAAQTADLQTQLPSQRPSKLSSASACANCRCCWESSPSSRSALYVFAYLTRRKRRRRISRSGPEMGR